MLKTLVHEKTCPADGPEYSPQAWYISLNAGLQVFEFFILRNAMRAVESSVLKDFSENRRVITDDFDEIEDLPTENVSFDCNEREELLRDVV